MTKAVALTIDTERFMQRILGRLFEHAGRALSEAMQNSRRAGATEIRFLITPDPEDGTKSIVHIADDGSGIRDWQALLTVAQSGWETALVDQEDAFGIGFAALLFGCRELVVRSRGHELRLNWSDAIKRVRFTVVESKLAPRQGTLIRLDGFALNAATAESRLRKYACGFALPVYLGDEVLPAPYRVNEQFVDAPVGSVWFREFGADGQNRFAHAQAYYQGLPIVVPIGAEPRFGEPSIVIHVNESAYPATAPDRAGLCDPEAFRRAFDIFVHQHWERALRERFLEVSNETFVESHWHHAKRFNCADLLDRCPVLPSHILLSVDGFPIRRLDGESNFDQYGQCVSRADVGTGRIVLAESPWDEASDDGLAFLTLARLCGWVIVSDPLPDAHWAQPYVISLDRLVTVGDQQLPVYRIEVSDAPVIRSAWFRGRYVDAQVDLVDRYAIALVDHRGEIARSAEIATCGLFRDGVLIVPAKEEGYLLCRQISEYRDASEALHEDAFEDDARALQDLIEELRGLSIEAIVGKALSRAGIADKTGVAGKAALVIFANPEISGDTAAGTHVIELCEASLGQWSARYPQAPLEEILPAVQRFRQALAAPKNESA